MARVARAGEGCVPAAQSRRMPERTLGLLLTSEGWWVGLGSKAAHEVKGANAWSLWQARRVEGIPVALAEALVPRIHGSPPPNL